MYDDIPCKKCGEPYSVYSLKNEIPDWDDQPNNPHDKFMSGKGCPTCEWGEKAGEVSRSRTEDQEQLEAEHIKAVITNTEDDPMKFI